MFWCLFRMQVMVGASRGSDLQDSLSEEASRRVGGGRLADGIFFLYENSGLQPGCLRKKIENNL